MDAKIGVLGGGQLGKMLFLAGAQLSLDISILDQNRSFPAGKICPKFTVGDFTKFDDVLSFGKNLDILTIEIEKINVDALFQLQAAGKKIYPQPEVIQIIQDKGRQKEFYQSHDIPTSPFKNYNSIPQLKPDLETGKILFPFIQKKRREGYDGRGVQLIKNEGDLDCAFTEDFLVEEKIDIKKEIAVIVCRDENGHTVTYDPVEMVFDPDNHILLYQISPADLHTNIMCQAQELAVQVADRIGIVGLLAIEMFLDKSGHLMVNEIAPRPHNSGHHTIEANICSQYENHLRAICSLPLGSGASRSPSLMMNLLGSPSYTGKAIYNGLEHVLSMPGVFVHIYGKEETRPLRKMGHITIIDQERNKLVPKYQEVSTQLKVIA